MEILDKQKEMLTGDLYKAYAEKIGDPVTDRRFRDFIDHLAQIKLIEVKDRPRGERGFTRLVKKI